jgi:hypothetical protein
MTPSPLKAALRVALAMAALPLLPAAAHAATWTVDDDGVQCPNASFSSIQDAVDYAAPHDTIVICAGLYQEKSTPTSGTYSPSQVGSRNGLTIQKPLTIKGAGASKVTIEPDPSLGDSLAGTTPYLRDGGGNVITIARQSLGDGDYDENTVDISGVTIRSPYAYAEAGVAYFNTSGTISNSVVGPLRRANADETTTRPYGWGVIETNFLQGGGTGSGTVRRQVTVKDSLVTGYQAGGILFDGARGADGTPETTVRAGIDQFGTVDGTKVVGGGSASGLSQTGIRYAAGVRGSVTGSTIQDNAYTSTTGNALATLSYGIMLADAETGGVDTDYPTYPDYPTQTPLSITGNALINNSFGLYNGTITSQAGAVANRSIKVGAPVFAQDNFWGCITGPLVATATSTSNTSTGCQAVSGNDAGTPAKASVDYAGFRTTVPSYLAVPAATADAAPTVKFSEPVGTPEIKLGDTINPVVVAADDFGVASVVLSAGGAPVATLTHAPYEFGWSPAASDAGKTVTLTATATDSSGQATSTTLQVKVAALPVEPTTPADPTPSTPPVVGAPKPPVNTALPVVTGDASVGESITCLPGSWTADPTAYAYQWLRAGAPISGANAATYVIGEGDTASLLACSVTAANADGSAAATSAGKLVSLPIDAGDDETTKQIGPVIADIVGSAKASTKTGKVTIGTVDCVRAAATTCTTTVTGTIKIGSKTYTLGKVVVKDADEANLVIVLPKSARTLLKSKTKTGTLSLKIAATDDTGFSSSWKTSVSVKGK